MQSLFRILSCILLCLSPSIGNSQNRIPSDVNADYTDIFATFDTLNALILAEPMNASAYMKRATFRMQKLKDLKGAIIDCNTVLTLKPNASDVYCLRASNELELHLFSECLRDLDRAIKADSTNSEAYWLRGNFEQLNNQLFAAENDFKLASRFHPQENKYSIQVLDFLLKQNEPAKALLLLNEKLKAKPADPELLLVRASMYGKVKRYKEALLDLAVVVKSSAKTLNPFLAQGTGSLSALGYYYRGIIYDSINQGEMGFNDMVMARSLGLADAYLYILNRFPQFRDPKMAAYQNLSYNIALMESKVNYKDGIDTCTRAIAQFPDSAMLYYTRAIYKRRLLKFTDAIADYQIAVKKDPHYSDAWMNMGLLQEHLGDTIAAMKNYQEAIQANPTNFRAYLNVGALLLDLHQYEQAIKYFKHGIACNLDETAGYQQLGDCYILLKQNEVGCEYYRIAEDRGVSSATMKRIHSCGISTSTIFK